MSPTPRIPDGAFPPPDVSASPRTIEGAINVLNALSAPVTIACFLESLDRPHIRILFEAGTGCGLCHRNEHEAGTVDGVTQYASLAYRPALHHALEEEGVRDGHEACAGSDGERCEILNAPFDNGPVLFTFLPEDLPTFGG